jgi:hypothetical protein
MGSDAIAAAWGACVAAFAFAAGLAVAFAAGATGFAVTGEECVATFLPDAVFFVTATSGVVAASAAFGACTAFSAFVVLAFAGDGAVAVAGGAFLALMITTAGVFVTVLRAAGFFSTTGAALAFFSVAGLRALLDGAFALTAGVIKALEAVDFAVFFVVNL